MTVLVRRLSSFALLCHVYTFWGTMLTWETAGTSVTGIYFCITGWLVYNYTIFAKLKIWSDASFCEEDIDIITCDRSIFMGNREMRFCPWFLGNLVCKFYLLQVTCVGMTPVKLYKLTLHQKSQQKQYAREYLITLSLFYLLWSITWKMAHCSFHNCQLRTLPSHRRISLFLNLRTLLRSIIRMKMLPGLC